MKILLLSPNQIHRYNWGHQLFRNEIGKHHDVIYYGDRYPNYNKDVLATQLVSQYKPDLVLTYGLRYSMPFQGLGEVNDVKKAHIVIDLFPPHPGGYVGGMHTRYKDFLQRNKYDIFFHRQGEQANYLKEIGFFTPAYLLPFSVDTNVYRNLNLEKEYDVVVPATIRPDVYPNRNKVNSMVKRMGLRCLTGKKVWHNKYIQVINQSKIAVISTNVFNSPNMKFTEFTSCGAFVLTDKPADWDELGFKDGEHLVLYTSIEDLKDKIKYFLKNDKERKQIAYNGMEFVRKTHNNTVRVKQFTDIIKKAIKK